MRQATLKRAALAAAAMLPVASLALAAEAADDVGFPQLKQSDTYASQIFWLAVCFVLLYALMSRLALPRVGGVIDARRAQRQKNLSDAETYSEEAAKVQKAFEASLAKAQDSAREILASAEQSVAEKVAEENAKFSEAARKRLLAAEQNIQKARNEALASLADISSEIAAEMAGKVANVQVSKADAKTVVASLMKG